MANRIEVTKLQSGRRYLVYHVYLASDGASGDLDSYELIAPGSENMYGATRFAFECATWGFNGFTGKLHFEELVDDTLIWVLPPDGTGEVDLTPYGGLVDRSTDGTGKLLLSTTGFTAAGDEGSIIIKVRLHS